MSEQKNQGFRGIPGVPEGWELVAIAQIDNRQWSIGDAGGPYQWRGEKSNGVYPIIRKSEKPKQFRPFANAFEYVAKRLDGIAVDLKKGETNGFYAIVSANDSSVWVAFGKDVEVFDWKQAFERLVFRHIDGSTSPFGAEVTQ
jgi:hypothetical protein